MKSIKYFLVLFLLLFGCSPKPQIQYYPVYKTLDCEDAVKPELKQLDGSQYISSKINSSILLSNFQALNLYVERLLQQIQCYKSQNKDTKSK